MEMSESRPKRKPATPTVPRDSAPHPRHVRTQSTRAKKHSAVGGRCEAACAAYRPRGSPSPKLPCESA
eukprot:292502-Prymnesium_polylepis.2